MSRLPCFCLAAAVALSACPIANAPLTASLDAPGSVAPCEVVRVSLDASAPARITWRHDGPPLALDVFDGGASFVAPVGNLTRSVRLEATAAGDDGQMVTVATRIEVAPASPGSGMAPGTAWGCGAFPMGVASGDPTSDGVLLWTRTESDRPVSWTVASDPLLSDVVASGEASADPARDWTVHVEVRGLPAGGTWWYRFVDADGEGSPLGRTRTAPDGPTDQVRIAAGSCSSLFSGWFNAYARIAERSDIDLVVHLGDYVYDFVDAEEDIRLTDPPPINPVDLATWRERFAHYLADPDLRDARAAHPWVLLWDNHDSDTGDEEGQGTRQAFREYVPMRMLDSDDPTVVHRVLRWGDLVDLYVVDAYTKMAPGSILGADQWAWLSDELGSSTAAWRVLATQKLVNTLGDPSGGIVGQVTDWDDDPSNREALFALLGQLGDNLILSGDAHFMIAADLVADPLDAQSPYDPMTGEGAVGVELLAAGISRGNFDETLCGGPCDDATSAVIENIRQLLLRDNPHVRDLELVDHGYGDVIVTRDRVEATMRYSPILWPTREERAAAPLVAERGAHRWTRP